MPTNAKTSMTEGHLLKQFHNNSFITVILLKQTNPTNKETEAKQQHPTWRKLLGVCGTR